MKLFNCNVRLAGSVLSEVPKYGISEMEIRVLQAIHGDDGVTAIKAAGDVKRSEKDEANMLAETYSPQLVSDVTGIKNVAPMLVEEDEPVVEQAVVAEQPAVEEAKPAGKAKPALE